MIFFLCLHLHLLIDNASASSQYKLTKLQCQKKKNLQFIYNNFVGKNVIFSNIEGGGGGGGWGIRDTAQVSQLLLAGIVAILQTV